MRALFVPAAVLQTLVALPPAYLGLIYGSLAVDPPPCSFLCFGPEFFVLMSATLVGIGVLLASLGSAALLGAGWARWTSLAASLTLAAILLRLASEEVDGGWVSVGITENVLRTTATLALAAAGAMAGAMLVERRWRSSRIRVKAP